jgi:Na+/H+-dicarboxylate symporter
MLFMVVMPLVFLSIALGVATFGGSGASAAVRSGTSS